MKKEHLFALLDMGMAIIKDVAVRKCLKRIEDSQRQYLIEEADQNRIKSKVVITALFRLDHEIKLLEIEYTRVKASLGEKGEEVMELIMKELNEERARLVKEKNLISQNH